MQLRSITLSTTGYLHSSSPYHPHGAPIFPIHRTKENIKNRNCAKQKHARASRRDTGTSEEKPRKQKERKNPPLPPVLSSSSVSVVLLFQGSNTPKYGSGESELVSLASFIGESSFSTKQSWVEWPQPVARRNGRIGWTFVGIVMKFRVWMSPVVDLRSSVRCSESSVQSWRR